MALFAAKQTKVQPKYLKSIFRINNENSNIRKLRKTERTVNPVYAWHKLEER
jgi:hypothetical protein